MHFWFLVEVLLLLIIFLVGCAAAAVGACAAYNISTEAERGTGYRFFLLRCCRLHCDASDVYCCCCSWLLLFLSLDCDIPVMVVECAAVETGFMLEKIKYFSPSPRLLLSLASILSLLLLLRRDMHFCFLVEVLLLLITVLLAALLLLVPLLLLLFPLRLFCCCCC